VSVGFFFQAEDGIRDFHVTGVQTCALPIFPRHCVSAFQAPGARHGTIRRPSMQLRNKQDFWSGVMFTLLGLGFAFGATQYNMGTDRKSVRVGKEGRTRWSP